MKTDGAITNRERSELRAVIKMHFKTLRSEVAQRRANIGAEVETLLAERFRVDTTREQAFQAQVREITAEANRKLHALVEVFSEEFEGGTWSRIYDYSPPTIYRRQREDREQVRKAMVATIQMKTAQARLDLDRREADMLRELALGAIETDAAQEFLRSLPGIDEVVPLAELRERALAVPAIPVH